MEQPEPELHDLLERGLQVQEKSALRDAEQPQVVILGIAESDGYSYTVYGPYEDGTEALEVASKLREDMDDWTDHEVAPESSDDIVEVAPLYSSPAAEADPHAPA